MNIAFIPYTEELLGDKLFSEGSYDLSNPYGPDRPGYALLKQKLANQGHSVHTIDRISIHNVDIAVMIDINFYYLNMIKSMDDSPILLYQMRESPAFIPFNTTPHIQRYLPVFDGVATWNPDIVALSDKCKEYRLPYYFPEIDLDEPRFTEQKLLCNISGRKYSTHPNELYSSRENLIHYFDEEHPEKFSLYGVGWESEPNIIDPLTFGQHHLRKYQTYEGIVDSKGSPYSRHKFALCFENVTGVKGYISEKMFDCLRYGIVPIYWGPDDICKYIPDSSFIDYTKFESPSELYKFISHMNEQEYERIRREGERFLKNEGHIYAPERFSEDIQKFILNASNSSLDRIPSTLYTEVLGRSKRDYLTYHHAMLGTSEYMALLGRLAIEYPRIALHESKLAYCAKNKLAGEINLN